VRTVSEPSVSLDAIRVAVLLYRQPLLARKMIKSPLPLGMGEVLRIAAEGIGRAALNCSQVGATAEELAQACVVYLQTVVCHPEASDTRLLALSEPVTAEELRDHKRLYFKWLHPDRNHNAWESRLFLRLKAATLRLEKSFNQDIVELPGPDVRFRPKHQHHSRRVPVHLHRQPVKIFWRRWLLRRALPVCLAIFVVVVGGWSVVAMMADNHRFDFAYGAGN
jgi:hypothetical protein